MNQQQLYLGACWDTVSWASPQICWIKTWFLTGSPGDPSAHWSVKRAHWKHRFGDQPVLDGTSSLLLLTSCGTWNKSHSLSVPQFPYMGRRKIIWCLVISIGTKWHNIWKGAHDRVDTKWSSSASSLCPFSHHRVLIKSNKGSKLQPTEVSHFLIHL